jgi:hypothetical protein
MPRKPSPVDTETLDSFMDQANTPRPDLAGDPPPAATDEAVTDSEKDPDADPADSETDPENEPANGDGADAEDGEEAGDGKKKGKKKGKAKGGSKVPKNRKPPPAVWENKIVGHGNINPKEVLKHNRNFRDHPSVQAEEMERVLDLIGWIDEIIISKRTNLLINGHLRLDRALKRKQPSIPYKLVDLTEEEEKTALLTFDYIGSLARNNAEKMDALFSEVKEGWDAKIAQMQEKQKEAAKGLQETMQKKIDDTLGFAKLPEYTPPPTAQLSITPDAPETLDQIPTQLAGAYELKDWMEFERGLAYDIPPLRPDMLAECPTPIVCWTTPESSPLTDYYVTVLGNGNCRTLPFEKTILLTHTHDLELETIWQNVAAVTKRFLNKRFMALMAPEFSVSVMFPMAERIWQTFRNRWVGRYWQEAGFKVIPTVSHLGVEGDENFLYAGIPVGCPCVSTQVQAHGEEDHKDDFEYMLKVYRVSYDAIINRVQPKQIIIYGGKLRTRVIEELDLGNKGVQIISIENFITARSRYLQQKDRANH